MDDYLVLTVKDRVLFKPTTRKSTGFQEIFGNESYIQPTLFSSSDNEYGGESSCQFETIEATIDNSDSQNGGDAESNFLRFKGLLNFDDNMKEITKASGGYCALKFNYPKLIDLRDYVAFELTLRSKNPIFMTVNMTCETYVLGDIFQIQIDLKGSSEWRKIYLPFSFFFLTRRGIEYDENRLNDNLMVESLGMLLRENRIGEKLYEKLLFDVSECII